MSYVPLRKAVKELGMHPNTLRKYADNGSISFIKNEKGQRLFDVESYTRSAKGVALVCYCRVSSQKQRDDLNRQVAYMQELYPDAEVIKDIGSGLNFKRKGLRSILERLLRGDKLSIAVATKDRLARFGFDLISFLVEQNGGTILVCNETSHSLTEELTTDLLNILTVFSCRMHGLRRYAHAIKKDSHLSDERPEGSA